MSTGFPIEIKTARPGSDYLSFCRLDIDIYKNIPNILEHEKHNNLDGWHGSEISVIIEGCWPTYKVTNDYIIHPLDLIVYTLYSAKNFTILKTISGNYTLRLF